jgi:hypothetical protein
VLSGFGLCLTNRPGAGRRKFGRRSMAGIQRWKKIAAKLQQLIEAAEA